MGGGASKRPKVHAVDCKSSEEVIRKHSEGGKSGDDGVNVFIEEGMQQDNDINRMSPVREPFPNNHEDIHQNNEDRSRRHEPEFYRSEEDDDEEDQECDDEDGDDEQNEQTSQMRMLFAQSAMSMDMDNEDLIFNLLYFGGDTSNFASMMSNAAEETVAAHSQGNTPYKLTPASESALETLKVTVVTDCLCRELDLHECLICQETIAVGNDIAIMPGCEHAFHKECVLKWFRLQSWCPVCRKKITCDEPQDLEIEKIIEEEEEEEVTERRAGNSMVSKAFSSPSNMNTHIDLDPIKSNLSSDFNNATAENSRESVE